MLSKGPSIRLVVARTEMVSRWKVFYNETPVEFTSEEGKAGRRIKQRINEMFSVTPGRIFLISVHQTERETDFI
ncbi:hypothetical protein T12_4719 [Trichinella patagoniensis]|uniref:Uncharacterized protein n=1 Tax=Trichinella patagoniensis TaxID=990121 RepID=A0A0V0YVY7_9BILA|nr:hypothetical protein T12_4719 [Trichinella patagoniensis]